MKKRLKIFIFEGSSKPPVFIKRLAEALAEKGHEICFLHFDKSINSDNKSIQYISLGTKNKSLLVLKSLYLGLRFDYKVIPEILKNIIEGDKSSLLKRNLNFHVQDLKPDLIHVQWPSLLTILSKVIKERETPVVLSQRGYQVTIKPFTNPDNIHFLGKVYMHISGFHSVSQAIASKGDLIYSDINKLDRVIYTGIDLDLIHFNRKYKRNSKLKILSVGRPHWVKSYTDVIEACKILKSKNFEFEYSIIGGKGNEELLFLIDKYGLGDKITIKNKVLQSILFKEIENSDLIIVSSIEEGLPNILVEAMAIGTPILSTSCGGVNELVKDGKNGFIVPVRSPGIMAEKIIEFSRLDEISVEEMRLAARKKVEEQHNYRQMADGMENLYREVLS